MKKINKLNAYIKELNIDHCIAKYNEKEIWLICIFCGDIIKKSIKRFKEGIIEKKEKGYDLDHWYCFTKEKNCHAISRRKKDLWKLVTCDYIGCGINFRKRQKEIKRTKHNYCCQSHAAIQGNLDRYGTPSELKEPYKLRKKRRGKQKKVIRKI